jgi:hypothetical protein
MQTVPQFTIDKEVSRDERLIWKGRPATGIKLRSSDATTIPFSLVWTGGAVLFLYQMLDGIPPNKPVQYFGLLVAGVFLVVGLHFVFGRFLADAYARKHTEYALTDQRAIIKSGIFSKKVQAINLAATPESSFTEKSDGSGTIVFGESTARYHAPRGLTLSDKSNPPPPAFEMIPNVRAVYRLVQEQQQHVGKT